MENDHEKDQLILVFKTNLSFKKDVERISSLLNNLRGVIRWNVDLSDIDNVLRIESIRITPNNIIQLISAAGYRCEELPD